MLLSLLCTSSSSLAFPTPQHPSIRTSQVHSIDCPLISRHAEARAYALQTHPSSLLPIGATPTIFRVHAASTGKRHGETQPTTHPVLYHDSRRQFQSVPHTANTAAVATHQRCHVQTQGSKSELAKTDPTYVRWIVTRSICHPCTHNTTCGGASRADRYVNDVRHPISGPSSGLVALRKLRRHGTRGYCICLFSRPLKRASNANV